MYPKTFKELTPLAQRCHTAQKTLNRYPDKVPVVILPVIKNSNRFFKESKDFEPIVNKKFLINRSFSAKVLLDTVRKRCNIPDYKALFMFNDKDIAINLNEHFDDIYEKNKDEDGFLYILIGEENTFG